MRVGFSYKIISNRRLTDPVAACGECGKGKRLAYNHPTDGTASRVCQSCYSWLTVPVGDCGECGNGRKLARWHPVDEAKGRVCQACYRRLAQSPEAVPAHVEGPAETERISA
jgi:hypothetical protein